MGNIIISFVPLDNQDLNKYNQVIDLSNMEEFINSNPNIWENYFKNFSSIKVKNIPLLNYLQLEENLNIWFYNKFRIFYDNRSAFYEIQALKKYLNNKDQFHIVSRNLKQSLFLKKNIRVINSFSRIKPRINYTTILKYVLVFIFRTFISKKKSRVNSPYILFFQIASERVMTSIKDVTKKKKLNGVWGYLEEQYHDEFEFIEDIPFPSLYKEFFLSNRMLKVRHKETYTTEYILFLSFFSRRINKSIKICSKKMVKNIDLVRSELKEPEELLIINNFKSLSSISKLYIRKYFAFDHFFNKTKGVKSITAYSENLSQSKIILDAASNNKIKTFGLQHGIIRPYNVGYSISKLESTVKPMPDITLVWGNYWKEQLIVNANYSPDSIKVVGQPRADIIPAIKSKFKRDKSLVSFFSQLQPDLNEKYLSAKSFVQVAKHHPDLKFIIKLHPAEIDDIYSVLIKEIDSKNISIDYKKDTFQLLAESGIIMTCFSTVGAEALCFGTPVISFDSSGQDIAGYIANNITHWVKNEQELNHIITMYKNKTLPKKFIKEYVNQTFSILDGGASKRIKQIISNSELT